MVGVDAWVGSGNAAEGAPVGVGPHLAQSAGASSDGLAEGVDGWGFPDRARASGPQARVRVEAGVADWSAAGPATPRRRAHHQTIALRLALIERNASSWER